MCTWKKTLSVLMVLVLLSGCSQPLTDYTPLSGKDAALVGTWKGTANIQNMALTVVFNADGSYTISGPGWTNYGTFSTDEAQQPKWINVLNQRGEAWLGLYAISGTTLRWGENKGTRPSSLEAAPYLYTLTKQ